MNQDQNQPPKGFLGGTSPKASFFLGLAVGIAAFSLTGFIILLVTANKDNGKVAGNTTTATNTNKTVTNTNSGIAIPQPSPVTLNKITNDDHIRGNKDAKVTLVEFSDFQCPFCSRVESTLKALLEEYKDKIRLVYKHFPLTTIHDQAQPAAEASECANEQGKFWEYHDALYNDQSKLATGYYSELAKTLGLNQKKFDDCFNSHKYQQRIKDNQSEGNTAGVEGTPFTVVVDAKGNTTPINGAYPQNIFESVINSALGTSK